MLSSSLFRIESAIRIGDLSSAYVLSKELIQNLESADSDPALLAMQLGQLGFICTALDRWEEARKHFKSARIIFSEVGDHNSANRMENALHVLTINDTSLQHCEVA